MSPFVLIALAALLGFIVGWFAHGPKEAASHQANSPASPPGPTVKQLTGELETLKQKLSKLETFNAGLEAMVHGRDATLTGIARKQAEQG